MFGIFSGSREARQEAEAVAKTMIDFIHLVDRSEVLGLPNGGFGYIQSVDGQMGTVSKIDNVLRPGLCLHPNVFPLTDFRFYFERGHTREIEFHVDGDGRYNGFLLGGGIPLEKNWFHVSAKPWSNSRVTRLAKLLRDVFVTKYRANG